MSREMKTTEKMSNLPHRGSWKLITGVLSVFVAVGTVGALMLPGITQNQYRCGLEEHAHTEQCYTLGNQLICQEEHEHTGTCYEYNVSLLTCELAEHAHEEACREAELSAEDQQQVEQVIGMIDALPDVEQVRTELQGLEAAGEEAAFQEYRLKINSDISAVSQGYAALSDRQRTQVANAELLEEIGQLTNYDNAYLASNGDVSAMVTLDGQPMASDLSFCVSELAQDTEDYAAAANTVEDYVASIGGELKDLTVLDMHFADGTGREVDPNGYATVTLSFAAPVLPGNGSVGVYHITQAGVEAVTADMVRTEAGVTALTIRTDGFSPYVLASSDFEVTILDSGHVDNGTEEGITWQLQSNDDGSRSLVFSGTGAIPDYKNESESPWSAYRNGAEVEIVFGEGITVVGNFALKNFIISNVQWASTIHTLGTQSFGYTGGMGVWNIPGTIKTVKDSAFIYCRGAYAFILNEGLEYIGSAAFGSQNSVNSCVINIPSTVSHVGSNAFWTASEILVAEGNPYYQSIDGVLYSKDGKTLIDYPNNRITDCYVVPEHVEIVAADVFKGIKATTKQVRLEHVVTLQGSQYFRDSSFREVYIADGNKVTGGWTFVTDGQLAYVRLPENTPLDIGSSYFSGCRSLVELKIPNGTTNMGMDALSKVSALTDLYYDAVSAKIHVGVISTDSYAVGYNMTVGKNVDYLYANFNTLVEHAETLNFDLENTFYVEPGAMQSAEQPLCDLEGWVHVYSQGDIYTLDVETKQATLFYQMPGYDELDLNNQLSVQRRDPATGEVLDEVYTVIGVGERALRDSNAKILVLEDASQLQFLSAYAFADAPIAQVVDRASNVTATTVEDAEALFIGAEMGYGIFNNTNLGNAPSVGPNFQQNMAGAQGNIAAANGLGASIQVEVTNGETTVWQPNSEDASTGGYVSLTGDSLAISVTAANTAGQDSVYRLYLRKTNDHCNLRYTPGVEYETNGVKLLCFAADDPNQIYLEFTNSSDEALNFTLYANYPSPESYGGGLEIQVAVMDGEQELRSEDKIQASWHVKSLCFQVDKQHSNNNTGVIGITSENDQIMLSSDVMYKICMNTTNLQDVHERFGLDIIKTMDFEDVLTLPVGLYWEPDVLQDIKDGNTIASGNIIYQGYVGGTPLVTITNLPTGVALQNPRLSVDESGQVVLRWRIKNTQLSVLQDYSFRLTFHRAMIRGIVELLDAENAVIRNDISATVNYTHTDAQVSTDYIDKTFAKIAGKIEASLSNPTATYFGEALTYQLEVYNKGGLAWTATDPGAHTLELPLSAVSCIYPENMEKMFKEAVADGQKLKTPLSIIIEYATLGANGEAVGTDGESRVLLHSNNSELANRHSATLTVTYDPVTDNYTVKAAADSGESSVTGPSLEELLWQLGFGINRETKYTCVWQLSDGSAPFTLGAGQTVSRNIYANAKNTFQYIGIDWPNEYIRDADVLVQTGAMRVLNSQRKQVVGVSARSAQVRREAYIDKTVSKNGNLLTSTPTAKDKDVLEYKLRFTHYGDGTYDDLPMVDALCGSQYLLVPVNENPQLAALGLEVFAHLDTDYYVLTEGTYRNVRVGLTADGSYLSADTVTVLSGDELEVFNGEQAVAFSGILTEIKWYYAHRDGGRYVDNISYFARVDTTNTPNYTIGNQVWMNDLPGSRIYAGLWGGGTLIDFDKQIVTQRGAVPAQDLLDEDGDLAVGEGDSVTYRLELTSNGNAGSFVLNGEFLADALPNTFDQFQWEKAQISVETVADFAGNEGELNSVTGWHDMETGYYLRSEYKTLGGAGTWFMCWDDDADPNNPNGVNLVFRGNATIYLYVTVTFPTDTVWNHYVEAVCGAQIHNTLYVHLNPASVTHVLKEPGKVRIQKGVYAMVSDESSTSSNWFYVGGTSRQVYNNRDVVGRYAIYYVNIYNDGSTRLYLNDIEDMLPAGFAFKAMINEDHGELVRYAHADRRSVLTCGGVSSNFLVGTQGITFRSATVRVQPDADDSRHLTFTVEKGDGDYAISYDETRDQFYLGKNEALVFAYAASIDTAGNTDDIAVNTVAMPYSDYTGAGVVLTEEGKAMAAMVDVSHYADQNDDGNCTVLSASQAGDYGFESAQDDVWLKSEVSLVRGSIRPGIHKQTVSFRTSENEPDQPYTNSVTHHDIVNWRLTFFNGGDTSIVDYTITDVMPDPYVFYGDVKYSIKDDTSRELASDSLFTILKPTQTNIASISSLTELVIRTPNGKEYAVPINGTPLTLTRTNGSVKFDLSFDRNENGNITMQLVFRDASWAVPSGGYLTLDYSSFNPTTFVASMTYLNEVYVYPTQPFRRGDIHFGVEVVDDSGKLVGVSNLSPVTVVAGVATDAYKTVAETGNPDNFASSEIINSEDILVAQNVDLIVIAGTDREVTYSLSVVNGTEANPALGSLTIIDNLPYAGDTYAFNADIKRNSEFAMRPSDTPDFAVKVTAMDGTATVLDPRYYVVQYSTKRSDFTTDERKGKDGADWIPVDEWTLGLDQVGSIRVIITDSGSNEEARIIPPGAKVSFSFDAMVSGDAETGACAWNNFGYHAKVYNGLVDLEAMPLTVGVRIASEPLLTKELTNVNGIPLALPQDRTFRFLVHTGPALSGGYDSEPALLAALEAAGRQYKIWEVTVPAGETYSSDTGLKLTGTPWNWTIGEQYTITELVDSTDYSLRSWALNGERISTSLGATFSYQQDVFLNLTCTNTYHLWDFRMYKESREQQRLEGGVFALYGKTNAGVTHDGVASTVDISGETWYLHSVQTTDANGTILWESLRDAHYYLVEVKAPSGYRKVSTPQMVSRPVADYELQLTVYNDTGPVLPNSGGTGTVPYLALGLALMLAVCLQLCVTLRKRRCAR